MQMISKSLPEEIILYRREDTTGNLKYPVRQPQEEAVSVVSYELVIQI